MGYGFIGYEEKESEESLFYTSCMYAYQPIFRECFGREITDFNGEVTEETVRCFELGVKRLRQEPLKHNLNHRQMIGYTDNITFDELIRNLEELLELMKCGKVHYLSID